MKTGGLEVVEGYIGRPKDGRVQAKAYKGRKVGKHVRCIGRSTSAVTRFDAVVDTEQRLKNIDVCLAEAKTTLNSLPPVAMYRGISSIPNEILALIFDRVYDANLEEFNRPERASDTVYGRDGLSPIADSFLLCSVLCLSHVSHKFRAVVLRIPRLWSHISMAYKPAVIDALLERSNRASLTIVHPLSTPFISSTAVFILACNSFMKKVLLHAWRIKDMLFCLDANTSMHVDPERVITSLKNNWCNMDLSGLETLRVHMPFMATEGDEEFDVDVCGFYSSWNLPSLRCLDFKNVIPTFPTLGSITHCTIDATDHQLLDLHALAQFLRVSPSTENLTIRVHSCSPLLHEETAVRLPNLRSFTILCRPDNQIPKLFEKLDLPRLEALSVTLEIGCSGELAFIQDEGKLVTYFPQLNKEVKTMTSLSITIRKMPPPYINNLDGSYLDRFLSKLPALEELYIEAPHTLLTTWSYIPKSRIRRLRLKNCDLFPISFFRRWKSYPGHKESVQAIDGLEEVEVNHCPLMVKEELVSILKGRRLTWLP